MKIKDWGKIPCSSNHNRTSVAFKQDFQTRSITRDKEENFIIIKVNHEDITILNEYKAYNRALKCEAKTERNEDK